MFQPRADKDGDLLSRAARAFEKKPFRPHPLFQNGHAQTLAAYAWPRRFRLRAEPDEERLFTVDTGVQVLAHCRWQSDRTRHPTIVIWHGIEGSSSSVYMLAMAQKGHQAGFNVIRMNLRNCGGTEHLTPTLYHGGLTEDLHAVVKELIEQDRLEKLLLVGFSLGGNMVLKLAGEYADAPPASVLAIAAVSPSIDLSASADLIERRANWLYQRDFLRRLRNRLRLKKTLYPDLFDTTELDLIRTIRQFDDRFTAIYHGFTGAADYYYKASSLRVIDRIRVPTLIIHGRDDPFIPFGPMRDPALTNNPNILLLAPEHGGHVAFLSEGNGREDRFWAENRVMEFCELASK
jgi:predicted alpha/beta-fold hydrolase